MTVSSTGGAPAAVKTIGLAVAASPPEPRRGRRGRGSMYAGQSRAGWLFVAPAVLMVLVFVFIPVLMALWVSFSDWAGKGSPLTAHWVGTKNYAALLGKPSLAQTNLASSFRNIFYYVLLVVPLQTILALVMALALNRRGLRGKGFFRTVFYFPSVTSSVAISIVFIFLFTSTGVVNTFLLSLGINGPKWFSDPRGLLHLFLGWFGVDSNHPPNWLISHKFFNLTWWEWLSGPSIAMTSVIILVIWTTSGTFMLIFLAALQDVPRDVQEAAMVDGATNWQVFRNVIMPSLRPTLLLVITLGLIGTWQMFDQVYIIFRNGDPSKTTLSPALLSLNTAQGDGKWGQGVAIAFLLFIVIVIFSAGQRFLMRDKDEPRRHLFSRKGKV